MTGRPIPTVCCTWCGHTPHHPKRCTVPDCPCSNHNQKEGIPHA